MRIRPALLLAAAPLLVAADAGASDPVTPDWTSLAGVQLAQVTIHERIMIRIRPKRPFALTRDGRIASVEPVWSERRAQKCVAVRNLAGAAVSRGGDVDLMMNDGSRLRAKLAADCPALDFYTGFYLKPNVDGRICGGRDVLRARSGASCPIARFRRIQLRR